MSVNAFTFAFTASLFPSGSAAINAMHSAITSISASLSPLVVTAGVPILTPLVIPGFCGSLGIAFLLHVCCFYKSNFNSLPVMFLLLKSTNIKWLSVPPDTRSKPLSVRPFASACAFATMFLPYSWNSGDKASLKQTALDAITVH